MKCQYESSSQDTYTGRFARRGKVGGFSRTGRLAGNEECQFGIKVRIIKKLGVYNIVEHSNKFVKVLN